ncbi:hypothetical protein HK102_007016 [Quaeritorhiza haematococci]|nr:hypothetical protein HK102_007016 [Quaeritorhiza haematococci]
MHRDEIQGEDDGDGVVGDGEDERDVFDGDRRSRSSRRREEGRVDVSDLHEGTTVAASKGPDSKRDVEAQGARGTVEGLELKGAAMDVDVDVRKGEKGSEAGVVGAVVGDEMPAAGA